MKKALLILIAILILIFAGCSFSFSTANLTDAAMTTAMVDGVPVDAVDTYSPDAEELIATCILNNAPDDTIITFVWYYEDDMVDSFTMNSDGLSGVYLYCTYTYDGLWPVGAYDVEMYVDEREEPDVTVAFTVE